jgi:hypothetical protein
VSYLSTFDDTSDPRPARAWRAEDGTIHGIMRFGDRSWPYLVFDSPAEARAHAAAATEIAASMERLEAESTALPAKGEGGDG